MWVPRWKYENLEKRIRDLTNEQVSIKDPSTMRPSLEGMIYLRLRYAGAIELREYDVSPFTRLHVVNTAGDKYIIFIVIGEEWTVLEDNGGMFPSDELIAKLKLLLAVKHDGR